MTTTTKRRLVAYLLWGLMLLGLGFGLVVSSLSDTADDLAPGALLVAIAAAYSTAGLMVALRVSNHRIGWLYLVGGLLASVYVAAVTYSEAALEHRWVGLELATWANQSVYFPMVLCLVALPLLLFPDGRVPSPGWRWVLWTVVAMAALAVIAPTVTPAYVDTDHGIVVNNPFGGIDHADVVFDSAVFNGFGIILIAVSLVAPAAAMVYRFRRSTGVERQQLKWLAYSATVAGVGLAGYYVLDLLFDEMPAVGDLLVSIALLGVLGIPVATALAIVHYRLFDIDHLISRTISYGLLIGLLAAVYVAGVFLLGSLPFQHGGLPVAASTLVAAALFNPFRRRLHAVIDRRFSRSGYDSQQVMDDFSQRVMNQVEMEAIVGDLIAVVRQTVVPATSAIWIRPTAPVP